MHIWAVLEPPNLASHLNKLLNQFIYHNLVQIKGASRPEEAMSKPSLII